MKIKKQFYKLSKKDFDAYIQNLINAPDTIRIFEGLSSQYFYSLSRDTIDILNLLKEKTSSLDLAYSEFSTFGKKQLLQHFFISEISSTNEIESIHSTRHDIFAAINNYKDITDRKITSIVKSYDLMLSSAEYETETLHDIRRIYDDLILESLKVDDKPDGEFFRKGDVYITDGIKLIHRGFHGEEEINNAMNDFLKIYNSDMGIFEKMILSHFMFEVIHPFYDGNGRMGRFLFSYGLYKQTKSILAFKISRAFSRNRTKYYSAISSASDEKEYGFLNGYVEDIANMLIEEINITIEKIIEWRKNIYEQLNNFTGTKSQKKIYELLLEGTYLSDFGLSNTEIQKETQLSKATVDKTIRFFKDQGMLKSTRIGYFVFHKLV